MDFCEVIHSSRIVVRLGMSGWVAASQGYIFSQLVEDDLTNQNSFSSNRSFQYNPNNNYNNNSCNVCNFKISKCGKSNCKTCNILNLSHTFISSVTGRRYHTSSREDLSCATTNVVYLLECDLCHLQYVGQTVTSLRDRMSGHRSGINKDQGSKVFYDHFKNSVCGGWGYKVQIIQKMIGTGRKMGVSKNKTRLDIDQAARTLREKCETAWMTELRTVFPYGFNERCGGRDWRVRGENDLVGRKLFKKLGHFLSNKKRAKKVHRPQVSAESSLDQIHHSCECNGPGLISCACVLNYSRQLVESLRKTQAKNLGALISEILYKGDSNKKFLPQYYEAILDMIDSKFSKGSLDQSASKSKPAIIFPVFFRHKIIQDVGLGRMFRDTALLEAIPKDTFNKVPTVVYKLGSTVRGYIFNYRQAIQDLDVDDFIANYNNTSCQCQNPKNSKFIDPHHRHIITGDLSIVEHNDLRKIMTLGPNFREQPDVLSPKIILRGIKKDLEGGIQKWAKSENMPIEAFQEWKIKCLEMVRIRLNKIFYQNKNKNSDCSVFGRRDVRSYLESFHKDFVITSIDKTTSNVGVVCKKFYIKNILEECGLWPGRESQTYEIPRQGERAIQQKLKSGVKMFGADKLEGTYEGLPFIYATIKMHKSPVKFRYIISSCKCITKPLARVAMLGMKQVQRQNEIYCNAMRRYTGINMYFITDNFQRIASDIAHINARTKAKAVSTYDFTSLYTNIKHEDLIANLEWYIDCAFKGAQIKGKTNLAIYSHSANWVKNPHGNTLAHCAGGFKALVKFLITNAYFKCGSKILRQKIGIPMGVDPAPQFANGHLHFYEFKFQKEHLYTNYAVAKSLNHTFRYIDDISPLNDNGVFEKYKSKIYPADLELNRENVGYNSASVLEMDIKIVREKFIIDVFDKRDKFNFEVFRYPSILSNIPDSTLYNVFYSQIVRFSRVCNNKDGFISALKTLKGRVISKGAKNSRLLATFNKFWKKYNVNYISRTEIIEQVF